MKINSDHIKHVSRQATAIVQRFGDIRFVGQVLFVALVLLISWSGVKTIQRNYELQKEIAALEQQNEVHKLRNQNLRLANDYYNSNQYLELAARQNFGLAAPGEKEIVVPKEVALAKTVDLPKPVDAKFIKPKQSAYERNFQAWVDFFLGRHTD